MKIVDCQVHIIPRETRQRPWANVSGTFHGRSEFTGAELVKRMDQAGIERAVVVPTFAVDGHRNDAVLAVARKWPDRVAAVGRIDISEPAARSFLTRWRSVEGLYGFRVTFQAGPTYNWLTDGSADWFWPLAEAMSVPIYIHAPGQLRVVRQIAERHPRLRLAIDHVGIPGSAQPHEVLPIVDEVAAMADLANVSVKVSGLPCVVRETYPFASLHGPMRRLLDSYGSSRLFWGSDYTRLPCSYSESWKAFAVEMPFISKADLEQMMGRALEAWLGWS